MSNYAEDYHMSNDAEKLDVLTNIYHNFSTTKEEKEIILKEIQKTYNRSRHRD